MKFLLFALTLLPLPANAATSLHCSGQLDFTFTAPEGLREGGKLEVAASGMFDYLFEARIDVVESLSAPLAVVNFTTLDGTGKINPDDSIPARLELALARNADGSLTPSGTARLQITRVPLHHPRRMLSRYDLSGCTGTL